MHIVSRFRVNRKIGVVGLGFFGPHLVNLASYDVAITIEDLRQRSRRIFATEFYNVPAFKSQMFYVTFDNMIVLEPNRFYNIGFQLDVSFKPLYVPCDNYICI